MRTKTLVMLFALLLSSVAGFSWAQEAPEGQMMGPGMMGSGRGMRGFPQASADRPLITFMLENKQDLSLSAEQVRSLEVIRSEFQQEAGPRITELQAAEQELDGLLRQTPLDLSKVEATLRKIEGITVALRLDRIKAIDQGRALLTREQQDRLQTLLSQSGPRPRRRG
ncbi:MAG: hypothetical protein A3G94_03865 [Deltaproteobacteria bacterium RIFCSPLOWO2_12_FULL_60_16]|nr:MAG: hypothetical protein A3G94_03865 [Deltaproteobacteria bacterium RIFCSPLOWO2_12_FULL_60_16]